MSKNCSPNHIIKTFLFPKSVAVFGASKNPLKGGNRIVNNLVYNKFEGGKEFYQFNLQKTYIFRNLINDEIIIVKLIDIDFTNDITDPEKYVVINSKTNKKTLLNSSEYS